jgi:hypothetical protein
MISHPFGDAVVITRPVAVALSSVAALTRLSFERYALPSLLVDQDSRIVHALEHAGRYLQVPGGELSSSVFRLIREELRVELRTAMQAAVEHGKSSHSRPILITLDGEPKLFFRSGHRMTLSWPIFIW